MACTLRRRAAHDSLTLPSASQLPAPPKPSEPQVDEAGYVPIFAEGDGAPKEQHRLWWAANPDNSKYPSAQPLASIDRCAQVLKLIQQRYDTLLHTQCTIAILAPDIARIMLVHY